MVMVTRSAYRKATESLNRSDISQKNIIRMPPWCSSGKVFERRKPRRALSSWETENSVPLRENIWDYLNDSHFDTRRLYVKKNKQKNVTSRGGIVKLLACLLAVLVLSVPFWIPDGIPRIELLKSVLPEVKVLNFVNLHSTGNSEECCYKLRHLTFALSRIERELRLVDDLTVSLAKVDEYSIKFNANDPWNMLRLRRKFMLSLPNTGTKTPNSNHFHNKSLVHGAKVVKGSDTEEWGTQVALWGVVPLWRTAPPLDTITALRKPKPSDCWPFSGSYGEVIIELPRKMSISSLSLEHIRPDTARSAPRNFVVYAIKENGTYVKAADGTYNYKKAAKQFYSLNTQSALTKRILFRVLSNQGNPKYTCIYRVQVYTDAKNTFIV